MGIKYKTGLLNRLREDFEHSFNYCGLLMEDFETAIKVIEIFKENISFDEIITRPDDDFGFKERYIDYIKIDCILKEIKKIAWVDQEIIKLALQSPVTRNRKSALDVIETWVEGEGKPLSQCSATLMEFLIRNKEDEVKEDLVERINGILAGKIKFE